MKVSLLPEPVSPLRIPGPNELPRCLDIPQVATILGIRVGRAYELARRGLIPSVKLGRQVRVDRIALERFLSSAER